MQPPFTPHQVIRVALQEAEQRNLRADRLRQHRADDVLPYHPEVRRPAKLWKTVATAFRIRPARLRRGSV